METFNRKQKVQETSYALPYHWLAQDRFNVSGRLYFGYLGFCANLAKNISHGVILDAGCGDGRFLGELANNTNNLSLYGTDYSERAIDFAKLLVPKAQFTVGEFSQLPYQDKMFDAIFMIETLEHIEPSQIPDIIKEFRRILKDDGLLVITVPSILRGIPAPNSKHYQHFTPTSLTNAVGPHFSVDKMHGQDKVGFSLPKVLYRVIDNSLFEIKPLRKFYNKHVWPKHFNICHPTKGRRLIAVCKKQTP